jgi:hypothetical protein
LLATIPLAKRLNRLGTQAVPTGKSLDTLTSSLDKTGAIEYLMSLLYYGVSATNSFDSLGHFARDEPMVGGCASYVKRPVPGCTANFGASAAAASPTAAAVIRKAVSSVSDSSPQRATKQNRALQGLLGYLIGSKP